MSKLTFQGVVKQGQIVLNSGVQIPEGTKVFVLVLDMEVETTSINFRSPRLAHPEEARDFEMEVIKP